MLVVPTPVSVTILTGLKATGKLLDGVLVKLFKNDTTPTSDSVLADFTLADFTGYAPSAAVVWAAPFVDPTFGPILVGDVKSFPASTPFTVPNTIYGYIVVDSAGTTLLWAERFAAPINVSAGTDSVVMIPTFGAVSQAAA